MKAWLFRYSLVTEMMQCQDEEGNWRRPESRPSMEQNGIKTEPKTPGEFLCLKNETSIYIAGGADNTGGN